MKVENNNNINRHIGFTPKYRQYPFYSDNGSTDCFLNTHSVMFGKKTEKAENIIEKTVTLGGDIHKRPLDELFLYLNAAKPIIKDIRFYHNGQDWNPLTEAIAIDKRSNNKIKYSLTVNKTDTNMAETLSKMIEIVLKDPDSTKTDMKKIFNGEMSPIVYNIVYSEHFAQKKMTSKLATIRAKESTARNLFSGKDGEKYKNKLLMEAEKEAKQGCYNQCALVYYKLFKDGPYKDKIDRENSIEESLLKVLGLNTK